MKTFKDIEFVDHPGGRTPDDKLGKLLLDGDITVSVICGRSHYCDARANPPTYEVAMFCEDGDFIPLGERDDVLGWQTEKEIDQLLEQAQSDPRGFITDRRMAKLHRENDL